jgi:uncharacterized protein with PQ loop repeat
MENYLNLKTQVTCVVDSIEFNNVFLSKLFFLIIFKIYFLTNSILKNKIKKKLLKTIKGPTIKKKHIYLVGALVKPMNQVTWASTSNLWIGLLNLMGL